jgi:hypothetical protein
MLILGILSSGCGDGMQGVKEHHPTDTSTERGMVVTVSTPALVNSTAVPVAKLVTALPPVPTSRANRIQIEEALGNQGESTAQSLSVSLAEPRTGLSSQRIPGHSIVTSEDFDNKPSR